MPMMPSPGGQPMPMQPQPPDMGQMAPQALRQRQMMLQLQEAAANGDPQAQQQLQQMQGGGGGPPQGGGMPPMQGAPSMSQADFSGYGKPPNPDQEARQTAQKIQLLRMLAAREGQGQ